MKVRLVVEGEKDRVSLDTIARRLGADVVAEGRGEKLADLKGLIAPAYFSASSRPDRIVVVDDCDDEAPETHLDRLVNIARRCRSPYPVELCVIACELEAWFLADWETATGARRRPHGWPTAHPETIVDAKEQLRRCLGGRWDQERAARLAAALDLGRVAERCDRWRGLHRFADAVGGRVPAFRA